MRNMSFMHTADHIRNRTKTVTRRTGWRFLKPGDLVMACERTRGLKQGQIVRLAPLRIISNTGGWLHEMPQSDVAREGFGDMWIGSFIDMFYRINGLARSQAVWCNRIEFDYLEVSNAQWKQDTQMACLVYGG